MSRSMCFSLNCFVVVLATAVMLAAGGSSFSVKLKQSCSKAKKRLTQSRFACRAAMAIVDASENGDQAGDTFRGVMDDSTFPNGCFYCKQNINNCPTGTWFNTNSSGQSVSGVLEYCQSGLKASLKDTSVLFLGDSDTDYWPAQRSNFAESHNLGVGGYTCKDVHNEIKAGGKSNNILKKIFGSPDTLVLVCGESDISGGTRPRKTFNTLRKIVRKAGRYGKVKRVIYLGTKPEPAATGRVGAKLLIKYRKYDAMVKQFALGYRNLTASSPAGWPVSFTMIDVYSAFEALGNPSSLYQSDGLHLSSQGYDLWTSWTQLALADTAGDCSVMQGSTCNDGNIARRLLDVMV